ncbi:hypothetical protein NM688_g3936 [Phlebia brevispora]|uniref:Uncharacterized protein n=1 Tax=Phlebia brevispora TaxID=194682 RepID=A0ACC1T4I8_9APHY|nr:hypothetical protein NM688_g3936 [Phlebia brevispora]
MSTYSSLKLLFFFLFASLSCAYAQDVQSPLSFHLASGGNDNYFLRDNITAAQLLLTSSNNTSTNLRRLVIALPAGNSGALVYFIPLDSSEELSLQLVSGSFISTTRAFDNAGVQADLSFSGNATLGVTIIGAVRAMRDYVEGAGTMHEIFNYTLWSYNDTFVRLHRRWINSTSENQSVFKGADLYLSVPPESPVQIAVTPGTNGSYTPPVIDILVPSNASGIIRVAVVTNETSLLGLDTEDLFLPESGNGTQGLRTALQGLAEGGNSAADQVSFLTYADKFTAGGWRFLTYFGRDSMIALRLLMPLLTSEAIESALGAVIERANVTGALCHEETIGDYASFINIQNNQSQLGGQPFYDYKMIDTDLYLLPALSHYFLELPQGEGRAAEFLERNATLQNGTYADIIRRNILYNFERAYPFSNKPTFSHLIGLRPGQPVGNWRDSNQGLGYGFYPFDVNTALVPAALRATETLLKAGILDGLALPLKSDDFATIASAWEMHAPGLFEVSVKELVAEKYLKDFVRVSNLSEALLNQDASSIARSNNNQAQVNFYALSLMEDGTPVEVMNSDMGFNLVYGSHVSQDFLQRTIDALQPYPRGLLTNIGMVIANPAYDSNRTNIEVLDRTAYHGTVIWSFQQGLMASGLARQLSFCTADNATAVDINTSSSPPPTWCKNATFVQTVKAAQARLWASINVADLASLSPDGVEADAIQLWSFGFLGLIDPMSNKTIDS